MASGVEELLDILFEMIDEAKSVPPVSYTHLTLPTMAVV